jgi:hypothetical protein
VTVLATANTGLSSPDVFYFGNLVGETGDRGGAGAIVSAMDLWRTRRNASVSDAAPIESPFDHNRDGLVNLLDLALVRANVFRTLSPPVAPAALVPAAIRAPVATVAPAALRLDEWVDLLG